VAHLSGPVPFVYNFCDMYSGYGRRGSILDVRSGKFTARWEKLTVGVGGKLRR